MEWVTLGWRRGRGYRDGGRQGWRRGRWDGTGDVKDWGRELWWSRGHHKGRGDSGGGMATVEAMRGGAAAPGTAGRERGPPETPGPACAT